MRNRRLSAIKTASLQESPPSLHFKNARQVPERNPPRSSEESSPALVTMLGATIEVQARVANPVLHVSQISYPASVSLHQRWCRVVWVLLS